jgi:DNA-binding NarL/FixJ family response regulator
LFLFWHYTTSQRTRQERACCTTFETPELVVEDMRAGASGYLLKDSSAEELCTAVRAVARGQVLLQAHERPAYGSILNASLSREVEQLGLTACELEVV